MKMSFSSLQANPMPNGGPKAARAAHVELQCLSSVPGHISSRHDVQILPGGRRYSKIPWLEPMIKELPVASTNLLRECKLTTVLVLSKNYHKMVHVWDSIIALAELWHPQTHTFFFPSFEATVLLEELGLMLGLSKDKKGEEHLIYRTVAAIDSWAILSEITTRTWDLSTMISPATGGPLFGSIVALECWMGMHINFKAMNDPSIKCLSMVQGNE
ncbi:hypothetical protein Taro_034992 [Colocasia esculenta]|uniref:Aminotransferase-like plant mobile domain-containing protein n=1 Tax=Colocasia esculenta TaxID=4460 RepID=A0A843W5F0_COLES|nr:hypothetical protein [Colocasia esculenta]